MMKEPVIFFLLAIACHVTVTAGSVPAFSADQPGFVVAQATDAGTTAHSDAGNWLVSPAEALEFKGEEAFHLSAARRVRSLAPAAEADAAPLIEILKPAPAGDLKVKAPFAIAIRFKGRDDAAIDPSTFKVMYGALKLDITTRITRFVRVTAAGFDIEDAHIPPGKHHLLLQVQDTRQRLAERELRVEVE